MSRKIKTIDQAKDKKQFARTRENKIKRIKKELMNNPNNIRVKKRLDELEGSRR